MTRCKDAKKAGDGQLLSSWEFVSPQLSASPAGLSSGT